jgi:predicted CoA-binding protein
MTLLHDPGIWVVVGLSHNTTRPAFRVARWLKHELGKGIIPVHPSADTVHGEKGYASIADIPDGTDIKVVDCFVNAQKVGAVVDEAIKHKDRLQIDAIWMQLDVVDEAAATRARKAGLDVVMDTCPKIEYPRIRPGE